MVGPVDLLSPGGRLIIVSECSEGLGSPEFVDSQRRLAELGPDAFLKRILGRSHAAIDEWQTQMQLKTMRAGRVQLFSEGLDAAGHALTGVERTESVEGSIVESVTESQDRAVAVIPEGPYLVPFYQP